MRFKKITIENFKSIGSNPIVVDLSENKNCLLLGRNGSGKTSIFEAIVWCIYGVTKLKADNVVNKTVGENTKVELEFSERDKDYIITRYRKHRTHKNNVYIFEDGNNISLKNQVDTQELIQKIVGIDSRAFMSSIVLSSETYKQFLRETNSVRLQIFESVFSLRELNDFKKIALQKIKSIENDIKEKDKELIITKNYNESDLNALRTYKDRYSDTISKIDAQIASFRRDIDSCNRAIDSTSGINFDYEMRKALEYQVKLNEFNSKKKDLDSLKKDLEYAENEYKILDAKINEYNDILYYKYSIFDLRQESKKNSEYEVAIEKKDELDRKLIEIRSEIKAQRQNLDSIKNKISDKVSEKEKINNKISEINLHVCPVCGNHLEDEKAEEIKKSCISELCKLDTDIGDLDVKEYDLEQRLNELLTDESKTVSELKDLVIEKPKYSMAEIKAIVDKMKEASSNLGLYKKRFDEISIKKEELSKSIKLYSLDELPPYDGYSVEWLNENKDNLTKLYAKIESLTKQIEIAEDMKKTAFDKSYVQKTMDLIKERKEKIEVLNSEIVSLRRERAQYQVLDDVFSNGENGFKKYFIDSTINLFNEKINTFLPFFFEDEIEIKFDKNLNDSIMFRGKETDFEELSSGEKTRAELCVIFSLYFMVQSLFGCGTNLLAVDELLDRGLDEPGIRAAKSVLDDISKNTLVFVVTHRDDLKELFSNVMTIYKDSDGFTKIK